MQMHRVYCDSKESIVISGIEAKIGTQLDEHCLNSLNSAALDRSNNSNPGKPPLKGTFTANGNDLIFHPDMPGVSWPDYVRQLQQALAYYFHLQMVQYTTPREDEFILEPDGSEWCWYSASSGLQYSSPDDYAGMYRM